MIGVARGNFCVIRMEHLNCAGLKAHLLAEVATWKWFWALISTLRVVSIHVTRKVEHVATPRHLFTYYCTTRLALLTLLMTLIDGLQVGVANDVIPLFGGQTREFAGA